MPNVWDEIFQQFAPKPQQTAVPESSSFPIPPEIQGRNIKRIWRANHGEGTLYQSAEGRYYWQGGRTHLAQPFDLNDKDLKDLLSGYTEVHDPKSGLATPKKSFTIEDGDYVGPSKKGRWRIVQNGTEAIFIDDDGKIYPSAIPINKLWEEIQAGRLNRLPAPMDPMTLERDANSYFSRQNNIRQQTQRYTNLARGLQEATKGVDPKSPMFRKLLDQVLKNQGFGDPSLVMNLIPRSLIQQVQEQVQKLTQPPQG